MGRSVRVTRLKAEELGRAGTASRAPGSTHSLQGTQGARGAARWGLANGNCPHGILGGERHQELGLSLHTEEVQVWRHEYKCEGRKATHASAGEFWGEAEAALGCKGVAGGLWCSEARLAGVSPLLHRLVCPDPSLEPDPCVSLC